MAQEHTVTVYTQPGCGACQQEKEFLSQNGVEFTEKDIRTDAEAIQEMIEMNSQSTPTTVIDGESIIGFDRAWISNKLGL